MFIAITFKNEKMGQGDGLNYLIKNISMQHQSIFSCDNIQKFLIFIKMQLCFAKWIMTIYYLFTIFLNFILMQVCFSKRIIPLYYCFTIIKWMNEYYLWMQTPIIVIKVIPASQSNFFLNTSLTTKITYLYVI